MRAAELSVKRSEHFTTLWTNPLNIRYAWLTNQYAVNLLRRAIRVWSTQECRVASTTIAITRVLVRGTETFVKQPYASNPKTSFGKVRDIRDKNSGVQGKSREIASSSTSCPFTFLSILIRFSIWWKLKQTGRSRDVDQTLHGQVQPICEIN